MELTAKAIITYGIDIKTSTGSSDSQGAWRIRPAATLYKLRALLRQRGYIAPSQPTPNHANPSQEPVNEPICIELHLTKPTEEEENVQTRRQTRARHTINITGDINQHDREEGDRDTEARIDMTVDDLTKTRSPTQICSAMNAINLIELNDNNNKDEVRHFKMGRQAEFLESDEWKDHSITHIRTTPQRAHTKHLAAGDYAA